MFPVNPVFAATDLIALTREAVSFKSSPLVTAGYLLQVTFSLLIVIGIMFVIAKFVLPKLQTSSKGRMITVVDRVGLEPSVGAYVIRVEKRSYLIVVSHKQATLIDRLE